MSKERITKGFREVFVSQKNLNNAERKARYLSDKSKIEQFINGCEDTIGEQNLVACYLHGSATRKYGQHNDLDLFMLCTNEESKLGLEAKFEANSADGRPYIDANFTTLEGFMDACKKPFSDGFVSKITRAGEELRIRIILSIIHGVPIYKVEKGNEILEQSKKHLEEHYGTKRFNEIMKWWEKEYIV
jgi:hypothetical protein